MGLKEQRQEVAEQGFGCGPSALGSAISLCSPAPEPMWDTP